MSEMVSYLRVSTKQQGKSGLGLDAQQETIREFAEQTDGRILREFREVESGKRNDRPQLADALAYARHAGATLVVARIDRLTRDEAFLLRLIEKKVDFMEVDNPHANHLALQSSVAVAEAETKALSLRVKEALVQTKKRGTLLGSARPGHWDGHEEARLEGGRKGRLRAAAVTSALAREEYAYLFPVVRRLRNMYKVSWRGIAATLNEQGYRTRTGKPFSAPGARRVLLYSYGA